MSDIEYTDDDEAPSGGGRGAITDTGKQYLRGALDAQVKGAKRMGVTYDELQEQRQEKVGKQRSLIDATITKLMGARQADSAIPLLAAASGFFAPTRTGSTGESLGNALSRMTPALAEQDNNRYRDTQHIGQLQQQGEALEGGLLKEQQDDLVKRMISGDRIGATLANALAKAEQGPKQTQLQLTLAAAGIHPGDPRYAQYMQAGLNKMTREPRGGGDYAPTYPEKLQAAIKKLPEGSPERQQLERALEIQISRGDMTGGQTIRLNSQIRQRVESEVASELRRADKEYTWDNEDSRLAYEDQVRERIRKKYEGDPANYSAPGGAKPRPQSAPTTPAPAQGITPISDTAETATPVQMPNVTTTIEERPTPPPIASPTPSAQRSGPLGAQIRNPSGEEKALRDTLTNTGIGLNLIDEVKGRLEKEAGERSTSPTTGVGGGIQRLYNNTVGQVAGNLDAKDAETMSKMAAIKPVLQKALKVDSNMSKDERKDLETILNTWDTFVSRDSVITNLKTVRAIIERQNNAARTRLGPRANEPVQQESDAPKRRKFNPQTGTLE